MFSLLSSKRFYFPLAVTLCLSAPQLTAKKEPSVVYQPLPYVMTQRPPYNIAPSSQAGYQIQPRQVEEKVAPTPSSTHTTHQATEWGLHKPITQLISHTNWFSVALVVGYFLSTIIIASLKIDASNREPGHNLVKELFRNYGWSIILPQLGLFVILYTITAFAPGFVSYYLTTLFAGIVLHLLNLENSVLGQLLQNSTLALLLSIALGAFLYVAFKDKKTKTLGAILQGCLAGALAFTAVYGVRKGLTILLPEQAIEQRTYSQLIPGYARYKAAYKYLTVERFFYPWTQAYKYFQFVNQEALEEPDEHAEQLWNDFLKKINKAAKLINNEELLSIIEAMYDEESGLKTEFLKSFFGEFIEEIITTMHQNKDQPIIRLVYEKIPLLPSLYQGLANIGAPTQIVWVLIFNTLTTIVPLSYLYFISICTFIPVGIYMILPLLLLQ